MDTKQQVVKLLKIRDVAELLQVTPQHVYNLVSAGKIPYIKIAPKVLRFDAQQIDEWIKSKAVA